MTKREVQTQRQTVNTIEYEHALIVQNLLSQSKNLILPRKTGTIPQVKAYTESKLFFYKTVPSQIHVVCRTPFSCGLKPFQCSPWLAIRRNHLWAPTGTWLSPRIFVWGDLSRPWTPPFANTDQRIAQKCPKVRSLNLLTCSNEFWTADRLALIAATMFCRMRLGMSVATARTYNTNKTKTCNAPEVKEQLMSVGSIYRNRNIAASVRKTLTLRSATQVIG